MHHLPFTFAITCTDGSIYFLKAVQDDVKDISIPEKFSWLTWEGSDVSVSTPNTSVLKSSFIVIPEYPIYVKFAHCGMLACLSLKSAEPTDDCKNDVIVFLSIYDCLGSGGAEWCLQDKIEILKLCGVNIKPSIDKIKQYIQLDWLFCEDGSYLLAVCIGSVIKIFSRVPIGLAWEKQKMSVSEESSTMLTQNLGKGNVPNYKTNTPKRNPLVKRQSTLDVFASRKIFGPYHNKKLSGYKIPAHSNLGWSQLTEILLGNELLPDHVDLSTILESRPVMISWIRDGFLIAASETEMHVFCHWLEKNPAVSRASAGIMRGDASIMECSSTGLFEQLIQQDNLSGIGT